MKSLSLAIVAILGCQLALQAGETPPSRTYPIVDTAQRRCYDDLCEIAYPDAGSPFFGQDAQYAGDAPCYRDNGDGTVSDLVTGLMWQADPGEKMTYAEAVAGASRCRTGGYDDWRLPSIKELYSLIIFSGIDPDPRAVETASARPFIDATAFEFRYGDPTDGDRIIDSQWASSTRYVGVTMGGNRTMFGVNFADGRIKGYPIDATAGRPAKTFYVIYVRGNRHYGVNRFVDNGDGTVTDHATGLTWMQLDSGHLKAGRRGDGTLDWSEALAWAEGLDYAGHDDWRLPNAKELQSIVDYSRSPDTTDSAAIDPVFKVTAIVNESGRRDYPCYWSGTTHVGFRNAGSACYVAFGRALGWMSGPAGRGKHLLDVHGAGAQRSDPKAGDPDDLPRGHGPQGDVQRIHNVVRCVRGGKAEPVADGPAVELTPEKVRGGRDAMPPNRGGFDGGREDAASASARRGDFIGRLDRDGDSKVSRREFDGPADHFSDFDRDGDGYISIDEAPTGPPPTGRPRR